MSSKSAKTSKTTVRRNVAVPSGKTVSKRMTVAQVAENLKSLETRLKGADTKNRNALKALESVVDDLKKTAKRSNKAQKSALGEGLGTLEIRMETYLERAAANARAGVRAELARVTALGANLTTLDQAVQAAHTRLDELDLTQREALARLNRHISHLAISVEKRLVVETEARKATTAAFDEKIDTLRQSFETRVEQVEEETATALTAVGDKITEFAAVLEQRSKTSDAETAERLADLAQEAQSEFGSNQSDVTARLEALEMIASTWVPEEKPAPVPANPYLPANLDDPRIDQMGEMIEGLQQELSRMHARMASVQPTETDFTSSAPAQTTPNNVVPLTSDLNAVPENPYASAVRALERSTKETAAAAPPPPKMDVARDVAATESHIPQEFDPTAFSERPEFSPATSVPTPPIPPLTGTLQPAPPALPLPPMAPPMASPGGVSAPQASIGSDFQGDEPLMPAPLPMSTYDDPAYAEGDDMRAERVGGETVKRRSASKPMVSGRNIRMGALALGVSVLGLFAVKTILGDDSNGAYVRNDAPIVSPVPQNVQNASFGGAAEADIASNAGTPPLGQYAELQTPNVKTGEQGTLDAAVKAGNPIAQFQKGLVQLQSGQMDEGARLIRLAANRNQPAAQYRLAKLYESGTGVAKDTITARELIERAAAGGNRIAMHDLGNYHAAGEGGLTRDMSAALDWFTKAAERGVVDSQFNVAFLREGNEGVPTDVETALFWYHIAARQGDQGAPERITFLSDQVDSATMADIKSRADRFNPKPVDEAANGVFRDVPWNKTRQATNQAPSAEIIKIREVQTLLSELGYNVGTPDGIAGSKTLQAVKSFEAVNGMPETGKITEDLIRKLEIASGA